MHVDIQGRTFTLKAIIAATKNFSRNNEIGTGRFGIVYKVKFHFIFQEYSPLFSSPSDDYGCLNYHLSLYMQAELSDQIKVAVKKVSPESIQGNVKDELQGELFFNQLKSLKHENLI